jgi:phosphoenolpyruvate carboxylase
MLTETIKEHAGIAGGTPSRLRDSKGGVLNKRTGALTRIIDVMLDACRNYMATGSEQDFDKITATIQQLASSSDFLETARVFCAFLSLAELAEKQHRIRR